MIYLFRKIIAVTIVLLFLLADIILTKVEVYNDVENYQRYMKNSDYQISNGEKEKTTEDKFDKFTHWGVDLTIFPDEITADMNVEEFQTVYYNPWDAQYVSYLTVKYPKDDYEIEKERLEAIGVADFTSKNTENKMNYYSVTGAPDNYNIIALTSNSYYGFVYAIEPKENDDTITYVEITFCNYFLDLDIHKYLPDKYLLKGFDASSKNPYQNEVMGR